MKTKKNGNHTPKKRCQPPDARRGLADVVQLLSRSANPSKSHRPTPAAEIGGNWWWEETGFHTKIRWLRIVWSCKLTTLKSFVKDWIPKKTRETNGIIRIIYLWHLKKWNKMQFRHAGSKSHWTQHGNSWPAPSLAKSSWDPCQMGATCSKLWQNRAVFLMGAWFGQVDLLKSM